MDISIIIVSWNVREHLSRCLTSIAAQHGITFEVFVVDNASTDGTAEWLKELQIADFRLQIILNEKNEGFAVANNQAIRKAQGKYILLLNPDTALHTNALSHMFRFMESHPRAGILGPRLCNADGTLQPSVRRFPHAWSSLLLSLGYSRGPVGRYLAHDFDYANNSTVDQIMGACFCIRRTTLEQIGVLDEHFFIWFEEVDYCKRAWNAGWEVWYTRDAVVTHHGGQSFAQVLTCKKQWMYARSLSYYFWKHRQWGALLLHVASVPFRMLFSLLV